MPVREQLRVEAVLEDAGDQRSLLVEDGLPLDQGGQRQDLVEGHPP